MIKLTLKEISDAVNGQIEDNFSDLLVSGNVEIDSRKIKSGDLFVAINGHKVNGADFAQQAIYNGAVGVISEKPISNLPCIVVNEGISNAKDENQSTVVALSKLAKYVLKKLPNIKKIALTGSSGKTTTKDLIADLAELIGPTVAPEGSFNNEIGLPLTILKCNENTKILVSEMGARRIGNIKQLCEIVEPDISIILNIGTAHIEIFGSKENILKAKSEIISTLERNNIAILNKDDESFEKLNSLTQAKIITFGTQNADVYATNIELDENGSASYDLNYNKQKAQVRLKIVGLHQVSNSLAAATALISLGIEVDKIAQKLSSSIAKSKLRMQIEKSNQGIEVINDTYNANPESVIAGLETLKLKSQNRKTWAILGEMRELGAESKFYHELVAQKIIELKIDNTLVIGEGAKYIYDFLMLNNYSGSATYAEDIFEAIKVCRVLLQKNELVLVKASRSIGLERVAQVIVSGFDENLISKIQEVGQ